MISIARPVCGDDFINRIDILKKLNSIYPNDHVVLVGPRRIGKSSIAEQFLLTLNRENCIKMNFAVLDNIGTPSKFAIRLLRSFLHSYFSQHSSLQPSNLEDIELKPNICSELAEKIQSKTLSKMSIFLVNYYPARPENEREVLSRVLTFLDEFSAEMKLKSAIVLDEFQDITDFNKFKGFEHENILGFLRNILLNQNNVWYLFTGSAVRIMIDILESSDSPFYGRVVRLNVTPFTKTDVIKLIYKCTDKAITAEAINHIYNLCYGHPFYTVVIARAAHNLSDNNSIVYKHHVEEAFINEISSGSLYSHCSYLFDSSLARLEKRSAFLKEVLREISTGELTVTELAQRVGRVAGNLSLSLRNLVHLDLIEKVNKKYRMTDPILEVWLRCVHGQREPDLEGLKRNMEAHYKEYNAALSAETGIFFESYMREMLGKFDDQEFEDVTLPRFERIEKINISDPEGKVFEKPSNIEIDALCFGTQNWICEFKYGKKFVGKKDIEIFLKKKLLIEEKLQLSIHKMLYVAKSGFSESALTSGVWCVPFTKLNHLLKMLNMKTISKNSDEIFMKE